MSNTTESTDLERRIEILETIARDYLNKEIPKFGSHSAASAMRVKLEDLLGSLPEEQDG